ncbi:inositol-pentakisphosphate 2-kinase [Mycena latifolia]|nr:inositol-pentakisphosphate 2-kinase [Mycena latifolia]
MPDLTDTSPTDWAYLSEGGATMVFSYIGPPNPAFDGKVLRVRKCRLELMNRRPMDCGITESPVTFAAYYGISITPRLLRPRDPTVDFQREYISRLIDPAYLPRLEPVNPEDPLVETEMWVETLAYRCEPHRPLERRQVDGVDLEAPTPVLATDLVGGQGIAVEIKPKWGFLPSPTYLSDYTRPVKTRTCRFCMHSHLKAQNGETVALGYCPLDLYSGDELRVKKALSSLWDAWANSDGAVNSFRVFVRGKKITPAEKFSIIGLANDLADPKEALLAALLPVLIETPVLSTLAYRQRTLDPLDIEGLAALLAQTGAPLGQPTPADYAAFLSDYLSGSPPADPVRFHSISYLLSATFKDCSVILRVPDGTATVIDLDAKRFDRVRKWQELDWEIASAYAQVPEAERKLCVDSGER